MGILKDSGIYKEPGIYKSGAAGGGGGGNGIKYIIHNTAQGANYYIECYEPKKIFCGSNWSLYADYPLNFSGAEKINYEFQLFLKPGFQFYAGFNYLFGQMYSFNSFMTLNVVNTSTDYDLYEIKLVDQDTNNWFSLGTAQGPRKGLNEDQILDYNLTFDFINRKAIIKIGDIKTEINLPNINILRPNNSVMAWGNFKLGLLNMYLTPDIGVITENCHVSIDDNIIF